MRYHFNRCLYRLRDQRRHIQTITSLSELDALLKETAELFAVSHDAALARLNRVRFLGDMPLGLDPYSEEYRLLVEDQYRKISGRTSYSPHSNEKSQFDLEAVKRLPFPYLTRSAATVGEQLVAQGLILSELRLPSTARVLEMGAGWGNLTLQLALTGYETHAVEIDKETTEVLKHRAANQHVDIHVHQCDMMDFRSREKFDAVIFFESFHHSFHPFALLELTKSLLKPGGRLILAGEPITIFPSPWGLRMDGLSLWSIRKYGWLELGFDTNFFQGLLAKVGFSYATKRIKGYHTAKIIDCRSL